MAAAPRCQGTSLPAASSTRSGASRTEASAVGAEVLGRLCVNVTRCNPTQRTLPTSLQAVADGVFDAELNELLMRELGGEGYSGVEVRRLPSQTWLTGKIAPVCVPRRALAG